MTPNYSAMLLIAMCVGAASVVLAAVQSTPDMKRDDLSSVRPLNLKAHRRWPTLRCAADEDAVKCATQTDCESAVTGCRTFWKNPFPVGCAGGYCIMGLKGFVPHWLLDRNDGLECCYIF